MIIYTVITNQISDVDGTMHQAPPSAAGRAARALAGLADRAGITALGLMALVAFVDVVLRIAGRPVTGAYELTAILVALCVYAGLPRVTLTDTHVRAGVFGAWLQARPGLQRALQWLRNGLTALTMAVLAVAMARFALRVGEAGDRAPFIELPLSWVAGFGTLALLGCVVLALQAREGTGTELG